MGFYLHTHNLKVEVFINCVLNYRMFQMSLSFLMNSFLVLHHQLKKPV